MQLFRGKQIREYERMLYQENLPFSLAKGKALFGPLNDKQNKLFEAFATDDYYFKRTAMDITLDSERIIKYAEILNGRIFIFYRIQGNMEFITSDNPVMTSGILSQLMGSFFIAIHLKLSYYRCKAVYCQSV